MYLIDTNVISEMRKAGSGKINQQVDRWLDSVLLANLYMSAVSILEIEIGVLQSERRDPQQGAMLRSWLEDQVLPDFEGRILSVDIPVARQCATLHVPDRQAERDALIAATALVHGMQMVTRNTRDFERMGTNPLNPWSFAGKA